MDDTRILGEAFATRGEQSHPRTVVCKFVATVTKPSRYELVFIASWERPLELREERRMERRWRADRLDLLLGMGIESLRDEIGFNSNFLKSEAIQVIRNAVYNAEDKVQGEIK